MQMKTKSMDLLGTFWSAGKPAALAMLLVAVGISGCGDIPTYSDKESSQLDIIGGTAVEPSEAIAKHTVMVSQIRNSSIPQPVCSGTLILDGTYVLTAAHCIDESQPFAYVSFNSKPRLSEDSSSVTYRRRHFVAIAISHQKLRSVGLLQNELADLPRETTRDEVDRVEQEVNKTLAKEKFADIALLKMVNFEKGSIPEGYSPIEFVSSDFAFDSTTRLQVAGYGITLKPTKETPMNSSLLASYKELAQKVVKEKELSKNFKHTAFLLYLLLPTKDFQKLAKKRFMESYNLHMNIQTFKFVVGAHGAEDIGRLNKLDVGYTAGDVTINQYKDQMVLKPLDSTKWQAVAGGDSGGPAFVEENGKLKLAGVASTSTYSNECTYTNVQPYLDWIAQEAKKEVAASASLFETNSMSMQLNGSQRYEDENNYLNNP